MAHQPDGSVIFDTELDESGLKKGLEHITGGITKAVSAAGAALSAAGAAVVKYGMEFESAFAGVKKTVDATDEQLQTLKQGILDMSTELPTSASEIAAVAEAAGQLGIKTDNILDFTRTMVDLGVSTNMSADEAATSLARLANITGMSQNDFGRLGSTIVALGNHLATTESEIVDMSLRLAGTGKQVGMTEDQIMALSGALSSVGLAAEAGGSAMSRTLSMMQLACEQGGDALDALAGVAGMTSAQFKQAFEKDATTALMAFLRGLNDAEKNGKSAIGVIAELGSITELSAMDTVVVRDALLRAAGASDLMAESLNIASEAWEENTALTNEASQRYETLESKIKIFSNTAKKLAQNVYEGGLEDELKDLVDFGTGLVAELGNAYNNGGLEGLVSAVGEVLAKAIDKIVSMLPEIIDAGASLVSALINGIADNADSIIDSALSLVSVLIRAITSISGDLIILGGELILAICRGLNSNIGTMVSTLSVALVDLCTRVLDYLPKFIETGIKLVQSLVKGILESIPDLLAAVSEIVKSAVTCVEEIIPKLIELLPELVQTICDELAELLPKIIDVVMELVNFIVEKLPEIINTIVLALPDLVNSIVESLLGLLPLIVDCGVQLFVALVQALPEIIYTIVNVLPTLIAAIVSTLLGLVSEIIKCGIDLLVSLVTALPEIIIAIQAVLPQIVFKIIEALLDCLPLIIQCGIDLLTALIADLPHIMIAINSVMPTLIANMITSILENQPLVIQCGIDLLSALVRDVPAIIKALKSVVPTIIDSMLKAFLSYITGFFDVGKNLIKGIGDGMGQFKDWIVNKAKSIAKSILDSIKAYFGIASPSKVFKKVIGSNLMLGLAEGITDTAYAAVNAMKDVASDIADVDFETKEPEIDFDPNGDDFDAIVANAKRTVTTRVEAVGTAISSHLPSDSSYNDGDSDSNNPKKPTYVESNIYLDGKKTARVITPYIEKEIAWGDK